MLELGLATPILTSFLGRLGLPRGGLLSAKFDRRLYEKGLIDRYLYPCFNP
ncbi:MAG: hypothetical protein WBG66_21890 [Geitlerinemataceae cyanobacterium]